MTSLDSAAITFPADTYRLRLPGPIAVPERVRAAIARPIVSHRGPEFRAIWSRTIDKLRPLLGTAQPIHPLATSGTGVMEAALLNIIAPGERLLIFTEYRTTQKWLHGLLVNRGLGAADRLARAAGSGSRLRRHRRQPALRRSDAPPRGVARNRAVAAVVLPFDPHVPARGCRAHCRCAGHEGLRPACSHCAVAMDRTNSYAPEKRGLHPAPKSCICRRRSGAAPATGASLCRFPAGTRHGRRVRPTPQDAAVIAANTHANT